ncbi:tRNA-guanine transglycosylase [Xylariomycetidae sp. FL2044]|nr:tRNA-guanine transglycosylase [Xylariomycetidae sp. FL2044]
MTMGIHGGKEELFQITNRIASDAIAARTGRLRLPKRKPIDTPNYIGITSRGAIPHMTPDVVTKHSDLGGVHLALEDFLTKSRKRSIPAIYHLESEREPLHVYTATAETIATILSPRRHPPIEAPMRIKQGLLSINTSTGFRTLENEEYVKAVELLRPDVTIPLADLAFDNSTGKANTPTAKRQVFMVERTEDWLTGFFRLIDSDDAGVPTRTSVFAPLLPISYPMQWAYIKLLAEEYSSRLSGLAIYDVDILTDLKDFDSLTPLPRLSFDIPPSPQAILGQVRSGIDICTVPFVNAVSDDGIALTFSFPAPSRVDSGIRPLGVNMWSQDHQVCMQPLAEGCQCYTCNKHHRAYVQHLLNAREMLGWTLLQIHNHQVMTDFFAGIRASLSRDPSTFEDDCQQFSSIYDPEFPEGTGTKPRARGYNFKSEGGQPKANQAPWQKFNDEGSEDKVLAGEVAGLASSGAGGQYMETPVVPDSTARELDKKGFAEIER